MARVGGTILCLAALAVAAVFLWGVYQGGQWGYWAIAIPVTVGFLAILALLFWIGWTMLTSEAEVTALPPSQEGASKTTGKTS